MTHDWASWHEHYDDPQSPLRLRLALVQGHLADALANAAPGPIRLVSLCAGQARDVIGVLPGHPRRGDVTAVLVELDPDIADQARRGAAAASLASVHVRQADAGLIASYADALPADVLLLCGIFGNISDGDIRRTVTAAATMCKPGGVVIWTRHRREPDLTPQLRAWFTDDGFEEVAFDSPPTATRTAVGVNRLPSSPAAVSYPAVQDLPVAAPLFTFAN